MKVKDLPAILLALSALLTSVAGFVKVLRAETGQSELYENAALQDGSAAEDIAALRERIEKLEKEKRR